jgi:signal transduction histidine kinase
MLPSACVRPETEGLGIMHSLQPPFQGDVVTASLIPVERFSFNSHRMLSLRDAVLRVWEDRLRETQPRVGMLSHPVLIDTMPVLYERLCAVLTPAYFGRDGIDVATIGAEHGVERANLTGYDAETILAEFQVFRSVLFDMLDAHEVALTGPERRALHLTIDMAMRESVRAFIVAANSLRERLAGALAHDLRQPVSNIAMGAQLILRLNPPPAIADWAGRILRNGERMGIMLKELLDALALQSGDRLKLVLTEFDLSTLVEAVAQRARDYQGADVRVEGVPVTGWWCHAALERALENLLNNAQKYGDAGAPIGIRLAVDNERAVISVRNQGKPIPPGEFEAIFQQFVRSKDAGAWPTGSWGLGLPYVRTVAESHGGSALVFSDAETGTVFVIDVPVDARPFQEQAG